MMHVRPMFWGVLALVLVLAVGTTWAASVPLTYKGLGVVKRSDGWHYQGTVPANTSDYTVINTAGIPKISANASANWFVGMGALVQNGGVVFNAAVPIASSAAAVAVTAVKANPAGLVTSAVASYLLSKGIAYAAGEFQKTTQTETGSNSDYITDKPLCVGSPYGGVNCGSADGYVCRTSGGSLYGRFTSAPGGNWVGVNSCSNMPNAVYSLAYNKVSYTPCTAPSVWNSATSKCVTTTTAPPVDSDWDAARVGYWPDPAILDLVRRGVALPTDKPVFVPESQDVPVSDPYVDPTTGKRYKDIARVTPQPSTPDTAMVEPVRQEVDEAGNPVTSGGVPVAPEKESDWCKLHPEASGCQPLDEVPDVEIPATSNVFSVNPVAGFGADNATCPAGQHLFTRGGQSVDWSWAQVCTFANGIRPLVLAFAWLAAIAMVVAVGRRS